jgi:uncharacterized protein
MNNIVRTMKIHSSLQTAVLLALLPGFSLAAEVIEIPRVPSAEEVQFSALADAAMARDNDQVLALLNAENPADKLDVNALGRYGTPALHWVIRYGDRAIAERLVDEGADVNLANIYGVRPLQLAIENGHRELVQWLLDAGADPEARDLAGEPPLFLAASIGDVASLDLLLQHGAEVDREDEAYGQTALMVAIRSGHAEAAKLLLEAGADINKQARVTETMPGKDAVFVMPSEIPGTLTQGAGLTRGGWPDRGVRQPFAGAKTPLLYATRLGDLAMTRMLVENGADLELADANGITPLLNAIINASIVAVRPGLGEHLKVASYLIEAGANVNAVDWYGQSPLWAAIDMRNLIYRSVSAESNNIDRETALELVKQLLEAGANPNVQTKEYSPGRHFILAIGSVEWVDMTGQTPFVRAARAGDVTVMKLLLEHGADANITTFEGTNALMAAAGVNFGVGETFDEGEAALLEAVKLAHAEGNDINQVNSVGLQAIHGAANRGANNIIRYLAENGAELDRPDKEGRTPVRWAEGEYLPSRPLIPKPETIALIRSYQAAADQ